MEAPKETPRGDEAEQGVEGVEQPGEEHHGVVEVDAHFEVISRTLSATGKIPVLVELTLTVFVFDGFVFKTALLGGAAPSVEGRARVLDTLVEGSTVTLDEGTTEHNIIVTIYCFCFLVFLELKKKKHFHDTDELFFLFLFSFFDLTKNNNRLKLVYNSNHYFVQRSTNNMLQYYNYYF